MSDFEKLAAEEKPRTLVGELFFLLGQTKKWWLLPIVLIVLVFGLLMFLSGTAAAPFIYTLF